MLKKRIIPCLDIKDGRTVKGVNFVGLRDAGDPVELAIKYVDEGADELMFLDISTTLEKRKTLAEMVKKIPAAINIPFTVGGGINSVEDSSTVINAGADKVSVNSSAVKNPQLITDLSAQFGSQCIVVAVDTRNVNVIQKVFVIGGKEETDWGTLDWVKEVEKSGASEILLTSMDGDGTKAGFRIDITNRVSESVNIPVIASGGAGKMEDFAEVFNKTKTSGGLAASVFLHW